MARRVLMAELSGGRVLSRPNLNSVNDVQLALRISEMTVEVARYCTKPGNNGEPWYICR